MELTRKAVVICGLLTIGAIVVLSVWLLWPKSEQDIKESLEIDGDNNKVETTQKKDFSLIHIEGLRAETGAHITTIREAAQRNNLISWGLFGLVFFMS